MTNREIKKTSIINTLDADSPLLLTQYSSEASQLIKSFTKYIPFVVITLIVIALMTTFDLVKEVKLITLLSDKTMDAMIISVSLFLVLFLVLTIRPILRSEKILNKWSNLFKNNAIRTSIMLTIHYKSKEEILNALGETIEQISIPLQKYLSKTTNHTEFYNVSIDDTNNNTIFDILIDKSTIKTTIIDSDSDLDSLRKTIQDYGSILIKIVDNAIIDKNTTQTFIESLQKYRRKKKDNKIGLAMLVGESIDQESYNLVHKIKDKNISENLILIEKHNYASDLENLSNILT
jgi:hypothetical protein